MKLVFSYVVKGIQIITTAKIRAPRRLRFEDTKRIMSPEMRPKSFGTFAKQTPCTTNYRFLIDPDVLPAEQLVWRAARGTGAAPSFFRAMGQFLDGGLIANNPTLDVMTDIHKYNTSVRSEQAVPMGLIVSLGTGIPPPAHVPSFDVFKPESVLDATNVLMGARALGELLIDQVSWFSCDVDDMLDGIMSSAPVREMM